MKTLLNDLIAGLLFLAVLLITGNLPAAIGVSVACALVQIAWQLRRRQAVPAIQWVSLALVVGLGGVSLATRDPLFVMLKPSFIQVALGATFLKPGWLRRYLPQARLPLLPPAAVVGAGYVYAAAMFALAAVNAAVAATAGPQAWAAYAAFGPALVFSALGGGLYLTFRRLARASLRQGVTWSHAATTAAA